MCCCNKPNINGEEGYSWNGKSFSIRKPFFPELQEGDELVRDLPGRCGGIDSHSFDLRLVKEPIYGLTLLVHHGAGQERIRLRSQAECLRTLSDKDCYWLLMTIYHVQSDAASKARNTEGYKWHVAAAERRIKTRKQRNTDAIKVWIEPATV